VQQLGLVQLAESGVDMAEAAQAGGERLVQVLAFQVVHGGAGERLRLGGKTELAQGQRGLAKRMRELRGGRAAAERDGRGQRLPAAGQQIARLPGLDRLGQQGLAGGGGAGGGGGTAGAGAGAGLKPKKWRPLGAMAEGGRRPLDAQP